MSALDMEKREIFPEYSAEDDKITWLDTGVKQESFSSSMCI